MEKAAPPKYNCRNNRGMRHLINRQPLPGRGTNDKAQGGGKSGIMELQAMVAHGAASFIQEKMVKESDEHLAYICIDCMLPAVYKKSGECYCQYCRKTVLDGCIGCVKIPYAMMVLFFYEISAGRVIKLQVEKIKTITKVLPQSYQQLTEKLKKYQDRVTIELGNTNMFDSYEESIPAIVTEFKDETLDNIMNDNDDYSF